jgi:ankyrin repeat protein
MRSYIKQVIYLIVLIGFSWANAGAYDDFFKAIKQDDSSSIQQLLNRGFDPNTRDPQGLHGLHLALREPSLKAAQTLIDWPKTDVDARNLQDETPLMMAALKGQVDIVRRLIAKDADVNKTGWAPLHYASTHGHLEIMQLLLEAHAYIDAESPNGTTPLMMAAMYGTPAAVKLLLEAGADPLLRNQLGLTAINFAHRAQRHDVAEVIAASVRARQPKGKW